MLFQSIQFAIFLPVVFLLYWFVFKKLKIQNAFVIVASYVFYGWWDWRFLILIIITSLCSYYCGLLLEKFNNNRKKQRLISAANITFNLLILCVFKYYNFFAESLSDLFHLVGIEFNAITLNLILPVGISFYTFQALSYTIDVYRKNIQATRDIAAFFAYISFFPQLVAGPIERATSLLPQFQRERKFDYDQACDGCRQILWGLFKKLVIADNCGVFVDEIFATYSTQSGSTLFVAASLFAIQIYADFSGYSDIAIGTAKLFGIKLMQNFKTPYFSRDIAEFWRHWHISLTTWFRDYLYIPLGGSRCSTFKIIRNTFVIFLISGFWHGANWTYIAWGAYHAILFLPLILLNMNRRYTTTIASERLLPNIREIWQIILTFIFVVFGWIIFRSETINDTYYYIAGIFDASILSMPNVPYTTLAFIAIMLIIEWGQRKKQYGLDLVQIKSPMLKSCIYFGLIAMIFAFGVFNETFIYFQF